jgi:hypothetical protein
MTKEKVRNDSTKNQKSSVRNPKWFQAEAAEVCQKQMKKSSALVLPFL